MLQSSRTASGPAAVALRWNTWSTGRNFGWLARAATAAPSSGAACAEPAQPNSTSTAASPSALRVCQENLKRPSPAASRDGLLSRPPWAGRRSPAPRGDGGFSAASRAPSTGSTSGSSWTATRRFSGPLVLLVPVPQDRHRVGDVVSRVEIRVGIQDLSIGRDDIGGAVGVCRMYARHGVALL